MQSLLQIPKIAIFGIMVVLSCSPNTSGKDTVAATPLVADTTDSPPFALNTDRYQPSCGIAVTQTSSLIEVTWPLDAGQQGRLTFDLASGHTDPVASRSRPQAKMPRPLTSRSSRSSAPIARVIGGRVACFDFRD